MKWVFCLNVHKKRLTIKVVKLKKILYNPEDVLKALHLIIEKANEIGLALNYQKCELSVLGTDNDDRQLDIIQRFRNLFPGIQEMTMNNAFLLGSPLTDASAIVCLDSKINELKQMTEKMKNIDAHSAYFLLKISVSTPRLIFFLRGNPMWQNIRGLNRYDDVLKDSLESILNIQLTTRAWSESSLPIKHGGIGIRHATDIALPCFLSSMYEVSDLVDNLLSEPYRQIDPVLLKAESLWCEQYGELPEEQLRNIQKIWESNEIMSKIESISSSLEKEIDIARFKANSVRESGAWLHALPSPQLGTHLSNDEFRVALSLRLGAPLVRPHVCVCGEKVNQYGHHGLSCSKANGTKPRHADGNNIFQRALKSAGVPAILEPPGCSRPNEKMTG